ncbi:putative aldouronate transport system substrate-binding protein [Paenibacillus castaneae]|uniref:extracellular solute-binding protein n=1 Tax=Paenibacillus castaneae TaxID=474957 RepID=UPI000C9C8175|nr:extracellular solute-binding protein [Paenibacillus castaneae]NIK80269.1 putative aldouronate transport system substrate-binding protein [Paenibacillus castaneae]
MQKKWKLSTTVASMTILAVLASGCGGSNNTPNKGSNQASEDKTVTYKFLRNSGIAEYPADGGEARKVLTEAAANAGIKGVDFIAQQAPGEDYQTKLNLLASADDLPDFFDIDSMTLSRFVEQGLVQPIDKYLENAPHLMKLIPQYYWDQVTFDGKIYALPNGMRPEAFNSPNVTSVLVRQDWLDALNLKAPTTLDELHDVLRAFVSDDPDQNGKNDTLGLSGTKLSRYNSIFGAYGIIPSFWMERDGQIQKGFTLPETKQVLTLLQQWYKEGLIDPDFPVMETKQLNEKIINSKVGLFENDAFLVDPKANPTSEALQKATPASKLTMIAPPKGPDGKSGNPETNAVASAPLRALSVKAQNPDKLFRYLDWLVDDSEGGGFNLGLYGVEGTDYTFDKEKNLITQSTSYADLYKKGYNNPIRMAFIIDRRWTTEAVREGIETAQKNIISNALWKTVPAELDYPDLETKLWSEYFVKIVTGVWSIDKFDEFVQKYNQQGGKQIAEQANEEWKKMKK